LKEIEGGRAYCTVLTESERGRQRETDSEPEGGWVVPVRCDIHTSEYSPSLEGIFREIDRLFNNNEWV